MISITKVIEKYCEGLPFFARMKEGEQTLVKKNIRGSMAEDPLFRDEIILNVLKKGRCAICNYTYCHISADRDQPCERTPDEADWITAHTTMEVDWEGIDEKH